MAEKIQNITGLAKIEDLTTPSSTQEYKLGTIIAFEDEDTKVVHKYIYVKAHAALTQYQPYVVTNIGTSAGEWTTAAAATLASAVSLVGVPQVAFTSGYYGFVQIEGKATSVIAATTSYIANNALRLATSGTSLIAASTSTVATVNSCAYLIASTTGTSADVILPGYRVEIATT